LISFAINGQEKNEGLQKVIEFVELEEPVKHAKSVNLDKNNAWKKLIGTTLKK
jgi:hypothetical protein